MYVLAINMPFNALHMMYTQFTHYASVREVCHTNATFELIGVNHLMKSAVHRR